MATDVERDRFRDWPAIGRWAVYSVIGLVILGLLGLMAGVVVVRQSFQPMAGTLQAAGLTDSVRVQRDARGVPAIYASNADDLFFAQGFVSAQDRFWQMDVRRHLTAGRLAEMVGELGVASDKYMRVLGWQRVAEQELEKLAPPTQQALAAYAKGVNAWLHQQTPSTMSLEYTALEIAVGSYRPADWTPVDSLAWLKALAWDLSGNANDEIDRARLGLKLTPEQLAEIYPAYPDGQVPSLTGAAGQFGEPSATAQPVAFTSPAGAPKQAIAAVLADLPAAAQADGIGSNAWAVSGRLTSSGKPMLANDPHLSVSLPGTFSQVALHCTGGGCPYDVAGFAMAGFPGVIVGRNNAITWGITNLKADVVDLYLEKVEKKEYLVGDTWRPLRERVETIKVAGADDRQIRVRETEHGPLLSDVSAQWSTAGANAEVPSGSPSRDNGYAVALNWPALTPGHTADGILALNVASDWTGFRAAAKKLQAPALNVMYADNDGHIGAQVVGQIPIRMKAHTGEIPAVGWERDQQPTGRFVPFTELPKVFDPPSGIIVSANQAPAGPDYPYRLIDRPDYGYRANRITALLEQQIAAADVVGIGDMTRIQGDTSNPIAPTLVPYLQQIKLDSRYYRRAQALLEGWDFTQPEDSAPAAYFNVVWSNLLKLTFDDQLPASTRPDGGSRWLFVMTNLLKQPGNRWWDDVTTRDRIENRDDILKRALENARNELVRRQSRDPQQWTWGHLHRLRLSSPLFGGNAVGRRLFGRQGVGAAGGLGAVNATAWDARSGYFVTTAPVFRMVVDLGRPNRSRWVNLAGQSGHAFATNFIDQRRAWLHNNTFLWPWDPQAVGKASRDELTLAPNN